MAAANQPGVVVARFLSVLELYRHAALSFEQLEPLGELTLRSRSPSQGQAEVKVEIEYTGADVAIGFDPQYILQGLEGEIRGEMEWLSGPSE